MSIDIYSQVLIFVHVFQELGNIVLSLEIIIEQAESATHVHRLARRIRHAGAKVPNDLRNKISG